MIFLKNLEDRARLGQVSQYFFWVNVGGKIAYSEMLYHEKLVAPIFS